LAIKKVLGLLSKDLLAIARDANQKKIKIWEIANFNFFDPKKVDQSRDLLIKSQKYVCKNVSYTLLFILSERFGHLCRRVGDFVCIWETHG